VKEQAIEILKEVLKKTKRVRFEGNSYSRQWLEKAAELDLKAAKDTPAAISFYEAAASVELHKKFDILTQDELISKTDIKREQYINLRKIEFKTGVKISETLILPAITRTLNELASSLVQLKQLEMKNQHLTEDVQALNEIYSDVRSASEEMRKFLRDHHGEEDLHLYATACAGEGLALLEKLRLTVDNAEKRVAENHWPIAKYQDLLNNV